MIETIGFFLLFLVLASLVGALATGLVRLIGFGVLAAFAIIIGQQLFSGNGLAGLRLPNIFSSGTPSATQTAPGVGPLTTESPGSTFDPSTGQVSGGSAAVGGPTGTDGSTSTGTTSFTTNTPGAGTTSTAQGSSTVTYPTPTTYQAPGGTQSTTQSQTPTGVRALW